MCLLFAAIASTCMIGAPLAAAQKRPDPGVGALEAMLEPPSLAMLENLMGMIIDMVATFTESIRAYSGAADSLDRAAAHIEAGASVAYASDVHDAAVAPYLDEIARVEQVSANLAATIGHRGGV